MTYQPAIEQLAALHDVLPFMPSEFMRQQKFSGPSFGPVVLHPAWDRGGLGVLVSIDPVRNERWLHVSFSRRDRIPDYADVTMVRRYFFRSESVVVQVFPPVSEYVNIHAHCLHLWERIDGPRLIPDLRREDPALNVGLAI